MSQNTSKKKCRQYSVEYLKFGFITAPHNDQKPLCLICEKELSNEAMKPSRLAEHLKKMHPDKVNQDLSYFQALRDKLRQRKSIVSFLTKQTQKADDGLVCSYNIAKLIAKSGNPHSIGEKLLLPVVEEVLRTVVHHSSPSVITKSIPLSDDTVRRRIDEMAEDIEESLCDILKKQRFGLQLDESTLPGNEALLLGYARFIKDNEVMQELLFAKELETDTRGASIFTAVEQFFKEQDIPMKNIIACATDGAPALTGKHKGFLSYLKKAVPDVFTIHCVIHRQHLVAKNLSCRLHNSLSIVVKSVNKIKNQPLNSRILRQLCVENNEEFDRLLLHTEVRWLSKGNCFKRFYSLFDTVVQFLQENKCSDLSDDLLACKTDIAYLTDLFCIFNDLNLQLQGDDISLIKAKSKICNFIEKLRFFRENIGRWNLSHFPTLKLQIADTDTSIVDDDLLIYCDHLKSLQENMIERYQDLINMEIPDWVLNPFTYVCGSDTNLVIQEDLIAVKNDFELKPLFKKSYADFWLQKEIPERYPNLWEAIKLYFLAFPSSYMAERGFSAVSKLLTKQRNRLQIVKRGDLRLLLSNIDPRVSELVAKHQCHPSH